MASTRISGDNWRLRKRLQISTEEGRYLLNVPGNGAGTEMPYQDDPHLRLQKWGANVHGDMMTIENHLRGQDRLLLRKDVTTSVVPAAGHTSRSRAPMFAVAESYTDQSRATDPAWVYRNLEQIPRWQYLDSNRNPQTHILNDEPFHGYIGSRMGEKDEWRQRYPVV